MNESKLQLGKPTRGSITSEMKGISHNKEQVKGAIHQKKSGKNI